MTANDHAISRRAALVTLGMLGVAAAGGAPAPVAAAPQFGQQELVQDALKRLFGARPIKDGGALVKLELPLIAENGAMVPITIEVQSPMTPQNYVKGIYVIADRNRIPVVTHVALTPEAGHAYVGEHIRLGETGDVRAIIEQSDGTLLSVKREVRVTVSGCGG